MHSHTQRFPHERVLLPRTKLAYVHLPNLLSDAKRDRSVTLAELRAGGVTPDALRSELGF